MLLNKKKEDYNVDIIKAIAKTTYNNGKPASDKMKILALIEYFKISYEEIGNSLIFSGRRYLFDEDTEEILKVIEVKH